MTAFRAFVCLGALASLACGGSGGPAAGDAGHERTVRAPDGGDDRDAGDAAALDGGHEANVPYPAPHPPMPQVLDLGGPVLAHPRVVPVFYEADPLMTDVVTLLHKLETATYWAGATAEYGVGPLSVTAPVLLPGPPPPTMDDANIQATVLEHLSGGSADAGPDGGAWPPPGLDTIYALFFAQTTSIAFDGVKSCTNFAGYHSEVTFAGGTVSYAVLPRCASFPLLPEASTEEILTVATSHELAEAATDPFPFTNAAYVAPNYDGTGWAQVSVGGEIGDMCVLDPSSFITPPDVGFLVQRVWSNESALASRDPCAPAPPGEVYFNAVPALQMTEMSAKVYVQGLRVPPGGSGKTPLYLFSDAKMPGPFTVRVTEGGTLGTRIPPDPRHQLSFSLDRTRGENGDQLELTVHRKPLASGETPSGLAFTVTSTRGAESHTYLGIAGYD